MVGKTKSFALNTGPAWKKQRGGKCYDRVSAL
jgi:hypothetical protein